MASKSLISSNTVDIYEIIFQHARNFSFRKKIKRRIVFDNLDATCVDESELRIYNRLPEQTPCAKSDKTLASSLGDKPRTIYLSSFTNLTKTEQTHNIQMAERTVATCRLKTTKSVNKCGNISIQLKLPYITIQVNWDFSTKKAPTTEKEDVTEKEQSWSLDSPVSVRFNIFFPLTLQKPHNHVKPFTPMHIALHVKLVSCSAFVADTQLWCDSIVDIFCSNITYCGKNF